MSETGNKNIVLVMGKPSSGKSTSLMKLKNQNKMVYLNTDLKELPFRHTFLNNVNVTNPLDVIGYINEIESFAGAEGGVLDTITFLMSTFERMYVAPHAGSKQGQAAWGDYGNFYRNFIHAIKSGTKDYAILSHESTELNEENMSMETKVPVKGAVGKTGVEADFTTILSAKQMPITKLVGFENELLHISDEEREDGFKYVFVTRITKDTVGERMRSAIGLWSRKELFIDNDLNQVFDRLKAYYN